MSEPKSRADIFEAAAKMMRMCDEPGVDYVFKFDGVVYNTIPHFVNSVDKYEFPLAIVEGKPVFKGDELYNRNGVKFIAWKITSHGTGAVVSADEIKGDIPKCCSWNPPKPKTVMVELSVEDADRFFNSFDKYPDGLHGRIARACCKALEELK